MSGSRDMDPHGLSSSLGNSLSLSASPTSHFHYSPPSYSTSHHGHQQQSRYSFSNSNTAANMSKHLKPFNTEDIRILLLENVNQTARDILNDQGYQVEFIKTSLPEDELIEKIRYVWILLLALLPCFPAIPYPALPMLDPG